MKAASGVGIEPQACLVAGHTPAGVHANSMGHSMYYCSPPTWLTTAALLQVFEQRYVESYLLRQGVLLPHYHRVYWMGLASNPLDYPVFSWLDASAPSLSSSAAYLHWGYYISPGAGAGGSWILILPVRSLP